MVHEHPELTRASALGLPLPWEPLDPKQGNRYEPRWGNAANSWRSLVVMGVQGQPTGIKQEVYLPAQRELNYKGSFFARHLSGPSTLTVSLRMRNAAMYLRRRRWTQPLNSGSNMTSNFKCQRTDCIVLSLRTS